MITNRGIDKINIGDFVQKVILLKPIQSRNSRGALEYQWSEVAQMYGKLNITPADEMLLDQNIVNQDRIEYTTYFKNEVTAEYRLKIDGVLYSITSVTRLLNQPLMVIKGEKITER